MEVETTDYKRCSLVTVSGRVDSNTAPAFEDALKDAIEGGQHNLVLDLNDVDFMSSAGLRAMVSALKACKGAGGIYLIVIEARAKRRIEKLAVIK